MNYNQQVVGADLGDAYTGQWVFYGPDESFSVEESLWVAALIASNHIGFRGGKLVFTIGATYAGEVPVSGSFTMEIVAVSVLDTWDPFDSATESVVEVLTSATIAWSFTSFLDPPVVLEITLGDMRPTDVGVPFNFYVRYAFDASYENGNTVAPIYGTSHVFQLSPRTDVPLWYFASTRNKVAPGGIVQPPAP